MVSNRDTIFALSSAQGRSGVAVIRVSGQKTRFVIETIAELKIPVPRHAYLRRLFDQSNQFIDSGLVLFFDKPHSFTGEDCAEFQIHGGRAVIKALLDCLASFQGCRLAEAGEFTKRALDNGKIDLIGAEALIDLIDAETEAQRVLAVKTQSGRLRNEIENLRQSLLEIMALVEASIDFTDEGDISPELENHIVGLIPKTIDRIGTMIAGYAASERLKRGLRVVLTGAVNAGKSTLLNALAGRDVAIVSHHPGTTRDQIEVQLDLNGWPVTITDTAGLRHTEDEVEIEGIARAHQAVINADVVLHLSPAGEINVYPLIFDLDAVQIKVLTKIDSHPFRDSDTLAISAHSGEGISLLLDRLRVEAEKLMRIDDAPVITHMRHKQALEQAICPLQRAQRVIFSQELLAEELKITVHALSVLIGSIQSEDVLGEIFSRFCIGK